MAVFIDYVRDNGHGKLLSGFLNRRRAIEDLTTHKDKLVALAERLVAEETVDSDDFEKMFLDLPPKQDLHGTPTIVGPAQPIPEPNPSPA